MKATENDKIFTVDLTLYKINGEDFVNFCGLLGKYELYPLHRLARLYKVGSVEKTL